MANSEPKIPISIYQIDKSEFGNINQRDIPGIIIYNTNQSRDAANRFIKQNVIKEDLGEFEVEIFHAVNAGPPKWSSFFSGVVSKRSKIFQSLNVECSYIAFITYRSELYACSGGQGNFTLERYAIQNFGMEILVRLIEKKENVIRKLRERSVTGNVVGQIRLFKGDQRFADEDRFAKVYREVDVELNRKILVDAFGFKEKDLRRPKSGCLAKDSFKINKSISFNKLLEIVSKLGDILTLPKNFELNKIIQVNKRNIKGQTLIKKLDSHFVQTLYQCYRDGNLLEFDFFHKQFEEYYKASVFEVKSGGDLIQEYDHRIDLSELLFDLEDSKLIVTDDVDTFRISFLELIINSSDDNSRLLTTGTILNHFHGEILFEEKSYFRIDGEWYFVKDDFVKDLNEDLENCLEQVWDESLLPKKFDLRRKERDYNFSYLNDLNYLVLDTITYENIEFCDIVRYDDENIHLIHVKKGFNNSIRELVNQIAISARRFAEDKRAGLSFADNIEAKAKSGSKDRNVFTQKIANQKFPTEGLKVILQKRDSQIVFCLAFVDTANDRAETIRDDVRKYQSNIAKYCILELRSYIQSLNFTLKVIQIKKSA